MIGHHLLFNAFRHFMKTIERIQLDCAIRDRNKYNPKLGIIEIDGFIKTSDLMHPWF